MVVRRDGVTTKETPKDLGDVEAVATRKEGELPGAGPVLVRGVDKP